MNSEKKRNKSFLVLSAVLAVTIVVCGVFGIMFATKTGPFAEKKVQTAKKQEKKEEKTVDPVIKKAGKYVNLTEYKNIELKKTDIDGELQSRIEETLENYATYEKIKKGRVKKGDTVNIYYVGKIDGKEFEGGACTKETSPDGYDLEIGSGAFIPGFEDGLIGKKIGQTCDVNATFPEQYPQNQELAGKTAVFTVTINYKKGKKIKSKLNDAFVKKNLAMQYTSAKDFKTKTREDIVRSMAVKQVVDGSEVKEYPEEYIDAMKKQLRTSIEGYMSQQGMTLDDYLKQSNTTKEAYDEQVEKTAKDNVGSQVVYNAIMQAENMEIAEKDYQTELDMYLKNYQTEKESDLDDTFEKVYGTKAKNIIYSDLIYNKVADYLAAQVVEI